MVLPVSIDRLVLHWNDVIKCTTMEDQLIAVVQISASRDTGVFAWGGAERFHDETGASCVIRPTVAKV